MILKTTKNRYIYFFKLTLILVLHSLMLFGKSKQITVILTRPINLMTILFDKIPTMDKKSFLIISIFMNENKT